ncbi:MAG: quinone-dependent dihydroorotate dehydrogenase [Acidobacteriota bacterium]|nr:quinone-dependent dihydroorotate dehydrogenase [Acidobacteriota bacterium]
MLYRSLLRPILFRLPPEAAHELVLHSLSLAPPLASRLLAPGPKRSPIGELQRFGLTFSNPIGLAAGFDKNGIALESLAALGFGFIEAGTVTYEPQPGNPRPRLFRLPQDKALINRAGFNNKGAAAFARRVSANRPDCVLGVSIGKSKNAPLAGAVEDYLRSFEIVYPVADYIAVNVSSPNTPGLRELQKPGQLEALLHALQTRNRELSAQSLPDRPMPLLIKLAPELGREDLKQIVEVARRTGVAGLIATNTTNSREGLRTSKEELAACGEGGLSGVPLRQRSTVMIATIYNLTSGTIPIIGVGGVFTVDDAWEKICAGACLIQIYTGFIYQGPSIAQEINEGLEKIMALKGFDSLDVAVGSRAKELAGL